MTRKRQRFNRIVSGFAMTFLPIVLMRWCLKDKVRVARSLR